MQMAQEPEEVEFVLTVLERLAQRYGNHPALWGIEVLNEPITELKWKVMGMPERYPACDAEKHKEANQSKSNLSALFTQTPIIDCAPVCQKKNASSFTMPSCSHSLQMKTAG
jgi:hypothetical protein